MIKRNNQGLVLETNKKNLVRGDSPWNEARVIKVYALLTIAIVLRITNGLIKNIILR